MQPRDANIVPRAVTQGKEIFHPCVKFTLAPKGGLLNSLRMVMSGTACGMTNNAIHKSCDMMDLLQRIK